MDYQSFASTLGQKAVQQIPHNIYREINIDTMIYAAKIGVFAGLVIAVIGTILGMLKFSALDLTNYSGCMITGQSKGKAPFIAGFIFHMIASVALGIAYLLVIHIFNIPGTWLCAIGLGVLHTLISASLMFICDRLNPCVANKKVARLGFMASALGHNAVLAFTLTHVIFGVIVVMMLTK